MNKWVQVYYEVRRGKKVGVIREKKTNQELHGNVP